MLRLRGAVERTDAQGKRCVGLPSCVGIQRDIDVVASKINILWVHPMGLRERGKRI